MALHQLLRYLHDDVSIVIFNLKGEQIVRVNTKRDISIDLYEYPVFELNIGSSGLKSQKSALYITLEK